MFTTRFSLESAYAKAYGVVSNYFSFFLFTQFIGGVACSVYLVSLGVVDFFALRNYMTPLIKMFHNAFNSATGPLHHSAFTLRRAVGSYLPSDLLNQIFGRDMISFDLAEYDIRYILTWIIPTALILKLLLDVMYVGWIKIGLDLQADKKPSARYLYQFYYFAPRVFLVNVIVGLATIAGSMLFLVPGIFIYQRFRFAQFFIIDKNLSMMKALQSSWALTEGSVLQLFGFSVINMIMYSLGNIAVVFVFFITPFENQVAIDIYSQLTKPRV